MKNSVSNRSSATAIFVIFTIFFCFFNSNSYGWSGYDFNNKVDIEIDPGNLVREGLLIQFYDSKTDSYHSAEILTLEYDSGGTMLQVRDLELNIKRTFIMQN